MVSTCLARMGCKANCPVPATSYAAETGADGDRWHILTAVGVHYYCGIVRDLENTYAELTVVEKMREGRKKA